MRGDELDEGVHIEALGGRDHELVIKVRERAGRLELRGHLLGLGHVSLREHEQLVVRIRAGHVVGHPLVATAHRLGRVNEKRHDVGVRELAEGALVELAAEGVLGLVQAGRVDDHELGVVGVHDGAHSAARGLGDGARDGELLAHDGVQKR